MNVAVEPAVAAGPASQPDEPIAIVGIGCRYADAHGPAELWEIVRSGRDTVREVPRHRVELGYDIDHFYDPRPRIPGRVASKKAGFLEHPELFDPAAFGLSPRDALTMDPQQRLMVEVSWDALEDAGLAPEAVAGRRCAVILGYMAEDYSRERIAVLGEEAVFRGYDVFTVGGMSHAVLSGRIAFLLGVTGPSFTLDTACSSSLVATHLACQSLRRGEADLALAGGANLFLAPEGNIALSRSGMLSLSGACRAFDANADGFVRAEGAGVVVLKRLSQALADRDRIYAVIRGSGFSSDGRDGGHMMAPGRHGQAQAMRDAYAQAGVDPARVQYVETHGTGTKIGDPVEIAALADVMGPGRDPEQPLRVASVKGNLGHSESASGVAGLIKACLSMHHRLLPAQLHFETPSPDIPWDEVPVRVQQVTEPWPWDGPALVGVNSFGISGTNAHVVLESPPALPPVPAVERPADRGLVLPLSAHDPAALDESVARIAERLEALDPAQAADLIYTLACRRARRRHRAAFSGGSLDALKRALRDARDCVDAPSASRGEVAPDQRVPLTLVFPGQGGQWSAMGRELIAQEPVFADWIDRLDAAYGAHVDWSLRRVLEEGTADWKDRLDVLQPVLVAFQIALAELWKSWGVVPDRVIGQSMGEIAAAFVAGAIDLTDVARLACHRGRIIARVGREGAMAVVSLSREAVESRLSDRRRGRPALDRPEIEVAGVNSPTTTIVAGDREPLRAWIEALAEEGVFARVLEVEFASHCFHMYPLLEDFAAGIEGLAPSASAVPFHSSVDGALRAGETLDADYWVRNLREPVAFERGLRSVLEAGGPGVCLEVSPHPSLARAIDETARSAGQPLRFVGSIVRDERQATSLARGLAELFALGVDVDLEAYGPVGRLVDAPPTAYQRRRYWFAERTRLDQERARHPLVGAAVRSSLDPSTRLHDLVLDADTAPFVDDHRVGGRSVAPASLFVELGLAIGEQRWTGRPLAVRALELVAPLVREPGERRVVQVASRRISPTALELAFSSRAAADDAPWRLHATARVEPGDAASSSLDEPAFDLEALESIGSSVFEEAMRRCDVELGASGRVVRDVLVDVRSEATRSASDPRGRALVGKLLLLRAVESEWHAYHAHPALVSAALQLAGAAMDPPRGVDPIGLDVFRLHAPLGSETFFRLVSRPAPEITSEGPCIRFDGVFFDRAGREVARIEGARARLREVGPEGGLQQVEAPLRLTWAPRVPCERAESGTAPIRRWLIVSDDLLQADVVTAELRKVGAECHLCERVEDLPSLVRTLEASSSDRWGVLLLTWRDGGPTSSTEAECHRAYRVASWTSSIREHASGTSLVWIATRGLLGVGGGVGGETAPGGTLARAVARDIEHFAEGVDLDRCRLFDASADLRADDASRLAAVMASPASDRWLISRAAGLLAPRLEPLDAAGSRRPRRARAGRRNFVTRVKPGAASLGVEHVRAPEPIPGPEEVVVEPLAVGLCRLDVLAELGLSPSARARIGHGFAGRVVARGARVDTLAIGDRVVSVQAGSLCARLAVPVDRVARIGEAVDPLHAATAVLPLVVAEHVLSLAARVRPGDRVLVDAGSGAVAHALVDRMRAAGCEVVALARSTRGAESLRRAGARVCVEASGLDDEAPFDVIASQCSDDGLDGLADRLSPFGRLVDLRAPALVAARAERAMSPAANRSSAAVDTLALLEGEPERARALIVAAVKALECDAASLGAPIRFGSGSASRALRFLAQNRHVGRVGVDLRDAPEGVLLSSDGPDAIFDGLDAVVVSGRDANRVFSVARALRERGVESVDEVVGRPTARPGGEFGTPDVWIHFAEPDDDERVETREQMRVAGASSAVWVALRDAPTGDEDRDRAWEARLFEAALGRVETSTHRCVDLSVDVACPTGALLAALAHALAPDAEGCLVARDLADGRHGSGLLAPEATRPSRAAGLGLGEEPLARRSPAERRRAVLRLVKAELGAVLGLEPGESEALGDGRPLDSLGLDSLMTMELFVALARQLDLEIDRGWFEGIPTLEGVARVVSERLVPERGGSAA